MRSALKPLAHVGHTAGEMVDMVNSIVLELGSNVRCKEVIISGGINDFLDGYYLINKIKLNSVYGQASSLLKYALDDYQYLHDYVSYQAKGLSLAKAYLTLKEE